MREVGVWRLRPAQVHDPRVAYPQVSRGLKRCLSSSPRETGIPAHTGLPALPRCSDRLGL